MDIVEWLEQYHDLEQYAKRCALNVDEARHCGLRSPSFDKSVRSSGTYTLDRPVARIEAEEARYQKAKAELLARLNELADMIDKLEEYDHKLVLFHRHLFGMQWSDVAERMDLSEASVRRIHKDEVTGSNPVSSFFNAPKVSSGFFRAADRYFRQPFVSPAASHLRKKAHSSSLHRAAYGLRIFR